MIGDLSLKCNIYKYIFGEQRGETKKKKRERNKKYNTSNNLPMIYVCSDPYVLPADDR